MIYNVIFNYDYVKHSVQLSNSSNWVISGTWGINKQSSVEQMWTDGHMHVCIKISCVMTFEIVAIAVYILH